MNNENINKSDIVIIVRLELYVFMKVLKNGWAYIRVGLQLLKNN